MATDSCSQTPWPALATAVAGRALPPALSRLADYLAHNLHDGRAWGRPQAISATLSSLLLAQAPC